MSIIRLSIAKLAGMWIILWVPFNVAAEVANDKTLSPYFQIMGENSGTIESLPLESTAVDVQISGVIADVRVTQVYRNRGTAPIDAVYIFPGSTRAAVYGMEMQVGERRIEAKIKERSAARATFQKARSEGKRASLLEQQRPNVFQMNVANIQAGDRIKVDLRYTELLAPDKGVYEFVYPTVVGPRYSETPIENAPDTETWVQNPYLPEGQRSHTGMQLSVAINAGMAIRSVQSPSHDIHVDFKDQSQARIGLKESAAGVSNRDFILQYCLQGTQIHSGVLLHEGEEENFFLLMSQPPQRVKPSRIPPREYIFVVDVSGSMHGFPLDTSKKLMSSLLANLRPSDQFNILFFSGGARKLAETSLPVNDQNILAAVEMLDRIQGGGGTRLLPALRKAMEIPAEPALSRSFVIVTDGYVAIEAEAFDYVRNHLNEANFFAFGIGSSVNRYLIEGLARAGLGEAFIMTHPGQAESIARRFREYIESPLLTNITIDYGEFETYEVVPLQVPDLFAERPLLVFGKWRGDPDARIRIRGLQGGSEYTQEIDLSLPAEPGENNGLRYLWARHRIAELGDYQKVSPDSDIRLEITSLGLRYTLLTAYTSFVAVDESERKTPARKQVKQPLPLPSGVSNLAVGGVVPTTPEPETGLLLLMLLLLAVFWGALIQYRRHFGTGGNFR